MPFPWKKVKNTKISQLVTDHLDSQRRLGGPPLVVETGFPTSLVDIFVRNRRRLKKPSKMRKGGTNSLILRSPPPSPLPLPSPPPELPSLSSSASSPLPSTLLSNMVEETGGKTVRELKKEDENLKGVLLAVLRMSFVVVLALGTKKFALGLTMSAFFLFFVEYVGIYVYRLFIPWSEAKKRLRMMVLKIFRIGKEKGEGENTGSNVSRDQEGQQEAYKSGCSDFQDQRLINLVGKAKTIQPNRFLVPFLEDIQCLEQKSDEFSRDGRLNLQEGQQEAYESGYSGFQDQRSIDPVAKVEIIQPNRFLAPFLEDIQCLEQKTDELSCDAKLNPQGSDAEVVVLAKEEEYSCEVKKRKSRRAKMKTKMKHIFSRKSRSKKKEEGKLEAEISPIGRENAMTPKDQDSGCSNRGDLKSSSDLSYISFGSCEGEGALGIISSSGVSLEEVQDVDGLVIREGEETQIKGNSGYLMLCLIVLIGLFGGRISALMFILSWYFLKKSGGKLIRHLTWPVIRFFNPNA